MSTDDIPLDQARKALRANAHADEDKAVRGLLSGFPLDGNARQAVSEKAQAIVARSRSMSEERGTLDAFLQEFGLSNQEGVALMCLAEALLRIPDDETQEELIAEKIAAGDWKRHMGKSEDFFVNAGVWALMLTGQVIRLDPDMRTDPRGWMGGLVNRLGEPVIREAILRAMRIMGRQFVFGRTIKEALKRQKKLPEDKQLSSFDMLGEGARTHAAAERYQKLYLSAIEAVGAANPEAPGTHEQKSSISIKLSALHPRYEAVQKDRVMAEMLPRVKELAAKARDLRMGLTIDAEEAGRLDISLDIIEALARDAELEDWNGLGLAVQAYQKRAPHVISWVAALARKTGRRMPVRLVKGAYWDTEIKHAQELGLPDYPVWTRKAATDLCYLACAHKMLGYLDLIYPQFATHNAHTIAAIAHMAGERISEIEYQRLHGMGDLLYKAVGQESIRAGRVRTYAPVGVHEDLLPYLVRRLLENGANSSFVNRFMDSEVPLSEVAEDPVAELEGLEVKRHPSIPIPPALYGNERKNSRGIDLAEPHEREPLLKALEEQAGKIYEAASIVNGKDAGGECKPVFSPADNSLRLGTVREAGKGDIDTALATAQAAFPGWNGLGGTSRADILEAMADALESEREAFLSLIAREAGRTIPDGISEVREAADFCRYYAAQARREFEIPRQLTGPTGETNELSLTGRGVFVCISPWNFPLAIFTGQIAAALAAGNCVVAKPAEQTPLIACKAVRLFHKAGVPEGVLHLLLGDGARVGAPLVSDERVAGVAFTGSTATAKAIHRALAARDGAIAPLIAETGGQNTMIVDSSALPEQVTDDVVQSAFSSAGQRCSALRVLYVQDSVADRMIDMIAGAIAERRVGLPWDIRTDIGPVIDRDALKGLEAHVKRMEKEATRLARADLTDKCQNGTYLAPHMYEIPSLDILHGEVFGPVLHVIRYKQKDIDNIIRAINSTGFGLTFGVHTRLERRWLGYFEKARVGNAYVNRNMIGAVVGVQPFGGMGLSGTGPKAGGPHYLHRFAHEKVLTINTAAIGGNTELFRIGD